MISFKLKKYINFQFSGHIALNTQKRQLPWPNTNILFVVPTTWQFHNLKITKLKPALQMMTKKAQILLRNVEYSSHNNDKHSSEGETSVFGCVFHNGGALRLVLVKPLCRCIHFAKEQWWNNNRYFKERLFTVVQFLDFESRVILTVFRKCVAGQNRYKKIFI